MNQSEIISFFSKFLDVFAWPGIVLIFIILFEENLRKLIDRIRFFKFQGIEVDVSMDDTKPKEINKILALQLTPMPQETLIQQPKLYLEKPASLFWLANDLMWLQDMLYRDAPSRSIIQGMENSQKYVKSLGLKDTLADIELTQLINDTQATLDSGILSWSLEYRLSLVRRIKLIKWFIADNVQQSEKNFKKYKVFPS